MIKDVLVEALYGVWPMIFIFTIILSSLRIAYLLKKKNRVVFYREFLSLIFIIYILILFYIVTFQDANYSQSNFIPFTEMFRYSVGSRLFFKNIIGNLLLFVPFGLFSSYYLKTKNFIPILILSFISSLAIELTQFKIGRVFDIDDIILNVFGGIIGYMLYIFIEKTTKKMPPVFRSEWFLNIIVLLLMIISILYIFNFDKLLLGVIYE